MTAVAIDVEPRVFSPKTGDLLRLTDAVDNFLLTHQRGSIVVVGESAETRIALSHAASQFGERVRIFDEPYATEIPRVERGQIVLFSARQPIAGASLILRLAPWDDDDVIDYLLRRHPAECPSVMSRLKASRRIWRPTTTAGWRAILDGLAANPSLSGPAAIVENHLRSWFGNLEHLTLAYRWAEAKFIGDLSMSSLLARELAGLETLRGADYFFREPVFRIMLQLDGWITSLREGRVPRNMRLDTSNELIVELANRICTEPKLWRFLKDPDAYHDIFQPCVATLLSRVDFGWRPEGAGWFNFNRSRLTGVSWEKIRLVGEATKLIDFGLANLTNADLRQAKLKHVFLRNANFTKVDLSGAEFDQCTASSAEFDRAILQDAKFSLFEAPQGEFPSANLQRANFHTANLSDADFTGARLKDAILVKVAMNGANLSGADLRSARFSQVSLECANFEEADLRSARFEQVNFSRCDFRKTILEGASFDHCQFRHANLEGAHISGGFFRGCDLFNAWLSDSVMPGADFRGADLSNAGLGMIEWEGADLRGANLRGVTFHFGSTRSGIVDSPYPSHGTRTGFYTDDFHDQPFKSPEEIRKANLCGADLRGVHLNFADFYLVDLRGAKFDALYLPHLQRCGAILKSC